MWISVSYCCAKTRWCQQKHWLSVWALMDIAKSVLFLYVNECVGHIQGVFVGLESYLCLPPQSVIHSPWEIDGFIQGAPVLHVGEKSLVLCSAGWALNWIWCHEHWGRCGFAAFGRHSVYELGWVDLRSVVKGREGTLQALPQVSLYSWQSPRCT